MAFMDADKLSYEIFSILESKFLFGLDDHTKLLSSAPSRALAVGSGGKIRILSIDGGNRPSDVLIAAAALDRLESSLRRLTGDPSSRVADLFDVAAGSGAGGVLAAMLFTRGADGRPLLSAADALALLISETRRRRGLGFAASRGGLLRVMLRPPGGFFRRVFGDATLRDTLKPVLIPCYDLMTGAPFLFSRADAVEADGYDFRVWEVCAATCADAAAVELRSVDGLTRVAAVGGVVAMANPTAAAITHVLHNKQEFPFAAGVEDLLVVSLAAANCATSTTGSPAPAELVRIAGEGIADMVDQAVSMAFGRCRASNYLRIQTSGKICTPNLMNTKSIMEAAEGILSRRSISSLLFKGKKISEQSNAGELDRFAVELIREEQRRQKSPIPAVVLLKQAMTPRTSSATGATTTTAATTASASPVH